MIYNVSASHLHNAYKIEHGLSGFQYQMNEKPFAMDKISYQKTNKKYYSHSNNRGNLSYMHVDVIYMHLNSEWVKLYPV